MNFDIQAIFQVRKMVLPHPLPHKSVPLHYCNDKMILLAMVSMNNTQLAIFQWKGLEEL